MASIELLDLSEPIAQAVCLVIAGSSESDLIAMGSAVMFADGLALTARHVIDELFKHFGACTPTEADGKMSFGVQVACRLPDGTWHKWHVQDFVLSSPIDIAALVLCPTDEDPDAAWPTPPSFNLRYPLESCPIAAYGFPESHHCLLANGSARVYLAPSRSDGVIGEIFHLKRDSVLAPFPCLRTDAPFLPGMSGGPVCDEHGHVIGLICSSMPPTEDDIEHVSYVSTLWPAFGLVLSSAPVTGLRHCEQTLGDFARASSTDVRHLDDITMHSRDGRSDLHLRRG